MNSTSGYTTYVGQEFTLQVPVTLEQLKKGERRAIRTAFDALYEHRVKLLAAAEAEPAGLFPKGDGSFEFQRTVSRLEEMRSAEYLAEGHGIDRA